MATIMRFMEIDPSNKTHLHNLDRSVMFIDVYINVLRVEISRIFLNLEYLIEYLINI